MRLKTLQGKSIYRNCDKYRINWFKDEKSKFQTEVKNFLYNYLRTHIVYSEFPVFGSLMRIDIFDATSKIAYEIDGQQHINYTEFFQKSRAGYLTQIKNDFKKRKFCEMNEIQLVEIFKEDLPLTRNFFKERYNIIL